MNPYRIQDALEERRQDKHQNQMAKDDWISKRTEELSAKWPETLEELKSPFICIPQCQQGISSPKAIGAYADLIWAVCEAQATSDWHEAWMLGEVA